VTFVFVGMLACPRIGETIGAVSSTSAPPQNVNSSLTGSPLWFRGIQRCAPQCAGWWSQLAAKVEKMVLHFMCRVYRDPAQRPLTGLGVVIDNRAAPVACGEPS
jgi:hypothetical protein